MADYIPGYQVAAPPLQYDWQCEVCGCTGSSEMRSDEGGWNGAEIVLALHRSISPDCKGSADTIRVTAVQQAKRRRR